MGGNAIMSKSFINLHGDYFETLTEPTQEILTAHLENGTRSRHLPNVSHLAYEAIKIRLE